MDGVIAKVGDSITSSSDGDTFMTVKSKEGYYVRGTVSELMLDQIQEGTELKCSTSNGEFNAKVPMFQTILFQVILLLMAVEIRMLLIMNIQQLLKTVP